MANSRNLVVACDVDGVLADVVHRVLERYNGEYSDVVTTAHITDWNVAKFVKPDCGKKVYGYFTEPDTYANTPVYPGALATIQAIRSLGHRVVFVSSCYHGTTDQKVGWLQREQFLPADELEPTDFIRAKDKSLIRADVLIDDYPPNLVGWEGRGILVDMPYNQDAVGDFVRVKSLAEAFYLVQWMGRIGRLPTQAEVDANRAQATAERATTRGR